MIVVVRVRTHLSLNKRADDHLTEFFMKAEGAKNGPCTLPDKNSCANLGEGGSRFVQVNMYVVLPVRVQFIEDNSKRKASRAPTTMQALLEGFAKSTLLSELLTKSLCSALASAALACLSGR